MEPPPLLGNIEGKPYLSCECYWTQLKLTSGVVLHFPYFHICIRRDKGSLLIFLIPKMKISINIFGWVTI